MYLSSFLLFSDLFSCALVFCIHACLWEGVGSPGGRVIDGSELPRGCWELKPGPLEELLTAEPSLQPPYLAF